MLKRTLLIFCIVLASQIKVHAQLFTKDTLFPGNEIAHRLSLSPSNHCWAIFANDKRKVIEIDENDQIVDHSLAANSTTASYFTDIQTTDQEVFVATNNDYIIRYKAGSFKKIAQDYGLTSSHVNSLLWTAKHGYGIKKSLYTSEYKKYLIAGTDKGIYITYSDTSFIPERTIYGSAPGVDSATAVFGNTRNSFFCVSNNYRYNDYCKQGYDKYETRAMGDIFNYTPLSDYHYSEDDSLRAYAQEYPFYYQEDVDYAPISISYWGTRQGLRRRPWSCTYGWGTIKNLEGISVNKITAVRFSPINQPIYIAYMLIGTDQGLYYCNGAISIYQDLKNDSIIFVPETAGYKIYDIDIDSCNSRVWLATDKGILRLNMHVNLTIAQVPELKTLVDPSGGKPLCLGDTVKLQANNLVQYTYQWQKDGISIPGAIKDKYAVTMPGTYRIIYTYSEYCKTRIDTSHALTFINDTIICKPSFPDTLHLCNNSLYTMNTCGPLTKYTYKWYNDTTLLNNTTAINTVISPGKYHVKVTNCNNRSIMSDTLVVDYVYFNAPVIRKTAPMSLCPGDSITLSVDSGNYKIDWYKDGNILTHLSDKTSYTTSIPGAYNVLYSNLDCGIYSETVNISLNNPSSVHISADKPLPICEKDTVTLTAINNSNQYTWSNLSVNKSIKVFSNGWYKVKSVDTNNCESEDSILVEVMANPIIDLGADTVFCEGYLQPVFLSVPSIYKSYIWNGSSTNQNHYNAWNAGIYVLKVFDSHNCTSLDTIIIENDCPVIFIPNLMTPNGDGLNDVFFIKGLLPQSSLFIYNQFGAQVYATNDYGNTWNSDGVSPGVYYYEFTNAYYNQSWKGWLHVIKD